MNTKFYRDVATGLFIFSLAAPSFAGVTFGDPKADTGALTVSATLRAKYNYKDYG